MDFGLQRVDLEPLRVKLISGSRCWASKVDFRFMGVDFRYEGRVDPTIFRF